MNNNSKVYPRGSEWRQWDLHIHTPASFEWKGQRFGGPNNNEIVDQMINSMNDAEPAVFALMDYWNFNGWFALKKRLSEPDAPKLLKMVFPGIELRLAAPMKGRLNAHVIFSDQINDQHLKNFQTHLKLELIDQPLSELALMEYARKVGPDKLKHHGINKSDLNDDSTALIAGSKIAEVNCDSYKDAIRKVPDGLAVGFMPFSTNDGLQQVDWSKHYAYTLGLFRSSPIFETRNQDQWAAFSGIRTEGNTDWFESFQAALENIPRLAVSGSDSHRFKGEPDNNDQRGYGDFPSGKKTWIKADPTWLGLLQALQEPAKRSFIGPLPPKLEKIRQNKTFYIDEISISKVQGSNLTEAWMDKCNLSLNPDLVAIIGNKGSGKSALADIIALIGNSQQQQHFSFLKPDRFRGKAGEPARQFKGILTWRAGDPREMILSDNPAPNKVELVKYIPQGRFEALCNEHVSGRSDELEKELRSVVFSHVEESVRLNALDFDQLIDQQESGFRANLNELRKKIRAINQEIVNIEDQLNPLTRENIKEQLGLILKQIEEHLILRPKTIPEPTSQLTDLQKSATEELAKIAVIIGDLEASIKRDNLEKQKLSVKKLAIKNIRDRVTILSNQFTELTATTASDFEKLDISLTDIMTFEVKTSTLDTIKSSIESDEGKLQNQIYTNTKKKLDIEIKRKDLTATLNEPQQKYQAYLSNLKLWQAKLDTLEGTESAPESKKGLEARLSQINNLPEILDKKKTQRINLTKEIYDVLSHQRAARAELFAPLQKVIQDNALVREEYKLQFQANLYGSYETIASQLFDLIKQSVGEIRGEEESYAAIKSRFEKYTFEIDDDVVEFTNDVAKLLEDSARKIQPLDVGIRILLRKEKEVFEVYDYIYALEYLEPKYTLLFQDTQIGQLSPGQRGALLLIFYLLVDKGRNPIVLDQPEENLDNETVVSLLVPVLNEAKKNRQIIMVTHNPNLAVVCDAEQIIYAEFDRKSGPRISYYAGSIEHEKINEYVVNVLEGTKPAFNNRGQKYHS